MSLTEKIINKGKQLQVLRRVVRIQDAVRLLLPKIPSREMRIYLQPIKRYVFVRSKSTDVNCLVKVFASLEYCVPFDLSPDFIVDAGANIGMATLYFAHRYPKATVVAVEPETSNFDILRRNCEGLSNVLLIKGALWPTHSALEIEDQEVDAWAFRVADHVPGLLKPTVAAITISDILSRANAQRIDLLKLDIEGAELELFSNGADGWIDTVQTIALELHDRFRPGCAQAFYSILYGRRFVQEIKGENIFVRIL